MGTTTALEHVNRMGVVYYLQEGKTSTGKPKYYTGRKLTGTPLAAVPEGYEVYEKPDTALVVVRRIKPSQITEFERKQTEEIVRRASGLEHFVVEIDGDALVIYTPSRSPAETDELIKLLAGPFLDRQSPRMERIRDEQIKRSQYTKMLRFALYDPDTRVYGAERWCFRGSIDDWFPLSRSGTLASLVEEYARHLNRESFFELW